MAAPTPAVAAMLPPAGDVPDPDPVPAVKMKEPPKDAPAVVSPALISILPPAALSPCETDKMKEPDLPPTAAPVLKLIKPLEPEEVVPVLNDNVPDTPAVPAFEVLTMTNPLEEPVDKPVASLKSPPDKPEDAPDDIETSAP